MSGKNSRTLRQQVRLQSWPQIRLSSDFPLRKGLDPALNHVRRIRHLMQATGSTVAVAIETYRQSLVPQPDAKKAPRSSNREVRREQRTKLMNSKADSYRGRSLPRALAMANTLNTVGREPLPF